MSGQPRPREAHRTSGWTRMDHVASGPVLGARDREPSHGWASAWKRSPQLQTPNHPTGQTCPVPKGAADKAGPKLLEEALWRGQRNQNILHGGGRGPK